MKYLSLISFTCIMVFFCILSACNQERRVVPFDFDADEVLKPLAPNDSDASHEISFGKINIPGIILDYEINSSKEDIYVFFENLTLLDINSEINKDLLEFINGQMLEYGFSGDSAFSPVKEYSILKSSGLGYEEISDSLISSFKMNFERQLPEITSYNNAFNITFEIYPVYLTDQIVTYRQTAYTYTGGAHGMTVNHLVSYDLNSGSPLTLEDIVKPDRIEEVREEVVARMAYSYPIYDDIKTLNQYIDSLNVWIGNMDGEQAVSHDNRITIKNFPLTPPALTSEGLVFIYQMYQLTPGADGCPLVLIPFKDLRGCLQPQF